MAVDWSQFKPAEETDHTQVDWSQFKPAETPASASLGGVPEFEAASRGAINDLDLSAGPPRAFPRRADYDLIPTVPDVFSEGAAQAAAPEERFLPEVQRAGLGAMSQIAMAGGAALEPALRPIEKAFPGLPAASETPFSLADLFGEKAAEIPASSTAAQIAQMPLAGIPGVLGSGVGREVIQAGGTPEQAQAATGIEAGAGLGSLFVPQLGRALPTRLIAQELAAPALAEVERRARNAVVPEEMQAPFEASQPVIAALGAAPFAFMPGERPPGRTRVAPREKDAPPATLEPGIPTPFDQATLDYRLNEPAGSPLEVPRTAQEAPRAPPAAAAPEARTGPAAPAAAAAVPPVARLEPNPEPPIRAAEREVENAPRGTPEEPATESATNHPIQEIPLDKLTLSSDVPQFKAGANAEGVVEPLGGKFDRRGVGPIQVWRRNDGSLEVISGRHRLDLARRSGEKTIPGQIYDEAQGFDAAKAATLDAELNIRDGQGKVKDYVQYFRNAPGLTEDEANARGLLARAIGKRAWTIASKGDAELIAAHAADRLTDEAATQIAQAAPNNGALQALGIKLVQEGRPIGQAANTMRAVSTFGRGPQTGDMFGFDDSAIQDATRMAQLATSKQRDIAERLAAITGASKRPELAAREGIDVKNPQAMAARIEQLRAEKAGWDDWATDPEKVAAIRDELGIKAPEPPPAPEPEPEAQPARIENAAQPDMLGGAEQRFEPPKPAEAPPPDMFGGATSADRLGAAQRATDARLSGNETAVPMRAGAGELFAGPRPEQATIPERSASSQIEALKAAYREAHGEELQVTEAGNRIKWRGLDGEPHSNPKSSIPRMIEGLRELAVKKDAGTEQAQPEIEPTGNPITDRFATKLSDHAAAVEEYSKIPDTEGGTVLSVDTARELSPDYLADRTRSEDVHEPGSTFIKKLYAEKLAGPTPEGKDPVVLFTAGGTGAGKTTGLKTLRETGGLNPEIIYDTNMTNFESSRAKVEQALDAGRDVTILYTYRDPVDALRNGALPRAMRQEANFGSGRTVPMAEHVKTHIGAYVTIRRLQEAYNHDARVKIEVVDNSLGKGNQKLIRLEDVRDPATIEDLNGKLQKELDSAHAAGEISDAVYRGFSGREPGEEARPGASRGAQPAEEHVEGRRDELAPEPEQTPPARAPVEPAAASSEPAPAPSTSIKNAIVGDERVTRGLEQLVSAAGKTDREAWEAAKERAAADPNGGRRLTAELLDKPRPISKDEVATLLHDRVRISNELAAAEKVAAETAGKTEAERAADLQRLHDAETERANNDLASRNSGTETALGLAARRMMARMDYSLDRIKERAAIAEGVESWDKIPAHVRAKYEEIATKLAEFEKRQAAQAKAKATRESKTVDQRTQERVRKQIEKLEGQIKQRLEACQL